jgi:hypothetical protein
MSCSQTGELICFAAVVVLKRACCLRTCGISVCVLQPHLLFALAAVRAVVASVERSATATSLGLWGHI